MSGELQDQIRITEQCYLSPLQRSDKSALVQHLADEEIYRNTLRIPFPYRERDAEEWLDRCATRARHPEMLFAIRDARGRLIGSIGISDELQSGATSAEFGYWLAKSYRGQGLMSRTIVVFAQYALKQLGLERLYAIPFLNNIASQRALENAGFTQEKLLLKYYLKDGAYLDAVRYVFPLNAHPICGLSEIEVSE